MKVKQLFPIALLALLIVACKKDRTCECVNTPSVTSSNGQVFIMNGNQVLSTTTTSTSYKKVTKADMKTFCGNSTFVSEQVYPNGAGGTYTITSITESVCELK